MEALEIRITWGVSTVATSFASPPRSFAVPGTKQPLVRVHADGSIDVLVYPDATGTIAMPGQESVALHELVAADAAQPFRTSRGPMGAGAPRPVRLPLGANVRLECFGLVFAIERVPASELALPKASRRALVTRAALVMALSLAAHGSAVGTAAYRMPKMVDEPAAELDRSQPMLGLVTMGSPAEEEPTFDDDDLVDEGVCRCHEIGVPGTRSTHDKTKHRYGVAGPADNADPHVARAVSQPAPWVFYWSIGFVPLPIPGDPKAYTMPWGREDVLGNDDASALGRMWGDQVGDVYGYASVGARPPPPPPPPPDEEDEDDTLLYGLIPSTVGHGTGYVSTSFDAVPWRRE